MAEELKNAIAQSLECPVCLNIFKDPKILSCSHTFCMACLDNLLGCYGEEQKLGCPVCRADTQVPNQDVSLLQTNLALKSLVHEFENQHQVCTNCKSEERPQAIVYCQDCGKYLCTTCQTKHCQWEGFSDHEVISMSEIASGKVSVRRFRKCRKHPREDEECFCSDCRRFACFRCVVIDHKDEGHRIIEASVYESNHLKVVEDLKLKADKKLACIQKYADLIDEQKDLVNNANKQCIDDISEAFEESVRQLTEKKELLIDEVNSRTTEVNTELDKMKAEAEQKIAHMNTVTDLVSNGTKVPLEMDALAAHDTLCDELQSTLKLADPDFLQPRESSQKGKCIFFERNVVVHELGLGKIMTFFAENITLPTKGSMNSIAATPDDKMAVGYGSGKGIEIFLSDGQLEETVLKDVEVRGLGVLSNGQYIVRDTRNNINLYTTEWEKLDVKFEYAWFETMCMLNDYEGGPGDLHVDSEGHIYVCYSTVDKIKVFSTAGGEAIEEIPCYEPQQVTVFDDLLIIKQDSEISIIDKDGNVKCSITEATLFPFATVTQDNRILIAWVNHDEGLVSIHEYNKELQQVKSIIPDYKIEKPQRHWYYFKEFQSGKIAFCTPDILYIFHHGM